MSIQSLHTCYHSLQNVAVIRDRGATVDERPLPIIEELTAKLLYLMAEDEDRGIVLVKERFTTEALSAFVREDPQLSELRDGLPLVRPTTLVGKEEMSDMEQLESLRKFRSGECNLLIATDIAQEGLDIPQCNFVIRYHFVSNEIGTMQAAGRARKEGSQCFLLVLKGDSMLLILIYFSNPPFFDNQYLKRWIRPIWRWGTRW